MPVSAVTCVQRRGAHAHPSRTPRSFDGRAWPEPASLSGRTRSGTRCIIAAVSAPTALALRMAEEAGITLVAVARDDGFEVFTHANRILIESPENVA